MKKHLYVFSLLFFCTLEPIFAINDSGFISDNLMTNLAEKDVVFFF